jgi:hypothetical protein
MSTTAEHDCQSPVTKEVCDYRHRGVNRWLSGNIVILIAVLGSAGGAYISARSAVQGVAVQEASQQAVNERVLDSLKRIEIEIRALRNGE